MNLTFVIGVYIVAFILFKMIFVRNESDDTDDVIPYF